MSLAGKLLVASPLLADPNFYRTVVLILTHDHGGAVGVILNKPSTSPVVEHLPAWEANAVDPAVVFIGGPVDAAVAIGLGRAEDQTDPFPGLGLIDLALPPGDQEVRIFSGYAGWGAGQLESELGEGAWLVFKPIVEDAFHPATDALWERVLKRQGGTTALLASFPPDPSLN